MLSIFEILLPLVAVGLIVAPLVMIFNHKLDLKKASNKLMAQVAIFAGVFAIMLVVQGGQFVALAEGTTEAASTAGISTGLGYIAAAIAVGCSCIGAGWAVAKAAPAALGAVSENPDNFGRAIIFVALGEGVAIYGLLISILIINKL